MRQKRRELRRGKICCSTWFGSLTLSTGLKAGGPSPGRWSTRSTWKQAPLGSKLQLESWVWPSLENEHITIDVAQAHSQSWILEVCGRSANMKKKREVSLKGLCWALIKLRQNFCWWLQEVFPPCWKFRNGWGQWHAGDWGGRYYGCPCFLKVCCPLALRQSWWTIWFIKNHDRRF